MPDMDELAGSLAARRWPVGRYRFDFRVTERIFLPEYAGSAIRGAFGWALRRIACMTHMKECRKCPLWKTCPYALFLESQPPAEHALQKFSQVPHPYVIEPPEKGRREYMPGDMLSFRIVLIGKALAQLPLVIYAMQRAFAREISGGSAELDSVFLEDADGSAHIVYGQGFEEISPHETWIDVPEYHGAADVRLTFSTPLRLQENGRPLLPEEISAQRLLMALIRRTALLMEFHGGESLNLPFQELSDLCAQSTAASSSLAWFNWKRYSSRQHQMMNFGGNVGTLELHGVAGVLMPFLYIGQWVHVGKNATFGLGRYQLSQED